MTKGEERVRVDFNVAGSDAVAQFKRTTAALIDTCEEHKKARPHDDNTGEVNRLWALAMTAYEEAAMWAVKAATAA